MDRRAFLTSGVLGVVGACAQPGAVSELVPSVRSDRAAVRADVRLVMSGELGAVRGALVDGVQLLETIVGGSVASMAAPGHGAWRRGDVLVGCGQTSTLLRGREAWLPRSKTPGGFRIVRLEGESNPEVVIAGVDAEGARNGLYRWLEMVGCGFFRDGERLPEGLVGDLGLEIGKPLEDAPVFGLRGAMYWDCYLGPRRFCPAAWGAADWERALLYIARSGMNFVEFYPPLEHAVALAFPELVKTVSGTTWKAKEKSDLIRGVLARGRALGIRFMYVLTYGHLHDAIRSAHPDFDWSEGGYLCADQPELRGLTQRVWKAMVEDLGTDHFYAVRFRGEEGQSYSNPCRKVTKAEGIKQAVSILEGFDPGCRVTVWTWSENVPTLFAELPERIEAVHIRHGLGKVFSSTPEGREQVDGAPVDMPAPRPWISAQFTLFGGHEAQLQTGWSDPRALQRDAKVSASDPMCRGFFHWPEWSGTSPWLAHVIAELAWNPEAFDTSKALYTYAQRRHGAERAQAFVDGFVPLIQAGNAKSMVIPSKRMVIPFHLEKGQHAELKRLQAGLAALEKGMVRATLGGVPALFARDTIDLATLVGVRLAEAWEAAACVHHAQNQRAKAGQAIRNALLVWRTLERMLGLVPELSLIATAEAMASEGPIDKLADTFWELGCAYYNGYPLVRSPEAIAWVYRRQCKALEAELEQAKDTSLPTLTRKAKWFWRDFPEPAWAAAVRKMPAADMEAFEAAMKADLKRAVARGRANGAASLLPRAQPEAPLAAPSSPSIVDRSALVACVKALTALALPDALAAPPRWPAAVE